MFIFVLIVVMGYQAKSIGGLGHLSSCFQGQTIEEKAEIRKRAGSSLERWWRFRERWQNKKIIYFEKG